MGLGPRGHFSIKKLPETVFSKVDGMEYERTDDGQIQAAFAQRVGQLLVQYDQWRHQVPTVEQFEATLTIALLQSLLTMCNELIRKKKEPREIRSLAWLADRRLDEEPPLLGLTVDCVMQRWPSKKGLTYRDIIECLRNALSHPLPQTSVGLPTTGFTTVQGASDLIESALQNPRHPHEQRLCG